MKTLRLTLKKKWFDMIESGEKKEEYREIKDYWINRLVNGDWDFKNWNEFSKMPVYNHFDAVTFKNGYSKTSPICTRQILGISIGKGKSEWGAEPNEIYFVIKLGEPLAS